MNVFELNNVTKSYRDVIPLKNVNLGIEDGEFISIIGPSGSGKTTLLNVIAGMLSPTMGEVIVDGVSLYELNQHDRIAFRRENIGFVFQSFNLIPYLTAKENVQVPLFLSGKYDKQQGLLAEALLEKVGLKDKGNRFPSQLSIGEQQRVSVARALANSPRMLFADEPTGNLDRKNGLEIMRYINELNMKGVTVLLVTHDSIMANFAQRKMALIGGRLMTW